MSTNDQGFELSVTIPATELATIRRRVRYLEATLIQVMRGSKGIKEWFSSADLEALRLPGLPSSKGAITRQAREQDWRARSNGTCKEYHFSTLPRRPFEALIDRVLAPAALDGQATDHVPAFAPPQTLPSPSPPGATPPWLLPLMRVVRSEAPATIREAVELLTHHLPKGAPVPTIDEAIDALRSVGMIS